MAHPVPGKHYRQGISLMELTTMFPDEDAAVVWFEQVRWADDRRCPHCGSEATAETPNRKPMPYRCSGCKTYFSVRTGTVLQSSRLPLRKWAFAVYLVLTNLKSVSSMKLHRDLGVTQKTAWFMLHRIREAWVQDTAVSFEGPVEVDETYVGGLERNKHDHTRVHAGRGPVGKTAVVGVKDRASGQVAARVVARVDGPTLRGFVAEHTAPTAEVYTDDASAYKGLARHSTIRHSAGEYVDGDVHTNGVESCWSMLKRAHKGTFHKMSKKHLQRYVDEFVARANIREFGTRVQMESVVRSMVGRRLPYAEPSALRGVGRMIRLVPA